MQPAITKKVIIDYFDGNYTSIQQKLIEEWLTDPINNELFYQYLDEWESTNPQYRFDIEKGLKKTNDYAAIPIDEATLPVYEFRQSVFFISAKWLSVACVILAGMWLGWKQMTAASPVSYKQLSEKTKNNTGEIYEKVNVTNKPIVVNLPDNSSVILQPGSKICYSPNQYNRSKRDVILSGEAFFEVQKDAKRPFFVYANELIMKVLGTSFSVKTKPSLSEIELVVKTGKVAVFLQNDENKSYKLAGNALEGLVVNANEKVLVNRDAYTIDTPTPVAVAQLSRPIQKLAFNFDDAPVHDVIRDLENAYGIRIVYDQDKLADCKLTAHLSDEPLLEKLKLICIALEASYEEIDNVIILRAKGCM
jgi:transmembrane sensor